MEMWTLTPFPSSPSPFPTVACAGASVSSALKSDAHDWVSDAMSSRSISSTSTDDWMISPLKPRSSPVAYSTECE
jgi:hypothetical protein